MARLQPSRYRPLAVVLAALLLLAACGGGGGGAAPGGGPTGESPTGPVTLRVGLTGDASFLNPVLASDGQSYKAEWPIFDSLVELDPNLNIRPLLAEDWEISEDGLQYTFHLKQGVKWHDGTEFTADDVAFTFYTILNPAVNSQHRPFFAALAGFDELTDPDDPASPEDLEVPPIEVVDRYTVRFNLRYPYAPFLSVLTNPRAGIVPKHLLDGKDIATAEFNQKPVGTGPFRVVEWSRDERIVLEAFDDYHGGRPAVDRIIFRIIPDPVVLVQELTAGGLDMIDSAPLEMIARFEQDPKLRVYRSDTVSYEYLGFRLDREPFSDQRVRQAIAHAVDMDAIIEQVLLGYATRATGQFPASSWAYNPDVTVYPYDPDRARELLAEAGWTDTDGDGVVDKNGQPLEFELKGDQGDQTIRDAAVIIQEQLRQVGIKVNVNLLDWPTFVADLFDSNFEAILVAWTNHPDPDPFAYTIWHSSQWNGRNFAHYSNPRVDELLELARRAQTQEERKRYYDEFQEILAEEVPYVWGWYPQEVYVVNAAFEGFEQLPVQAGLYQSLRQVRPAGN